MVYRVYVEKRKGYTHESDSLFHQLYNLLQVKRLKGLRIINRYDVENIGEELFAQSVKTVFSEPQVDITYNNLQIDTPYYFLSQYLLGQFDQRADSAEQCIQLISQQARPTVKTAKIYLLYGELLPSDVEKIKNYCINPIECCEAQTELPKTLTVPYSTPTSVEVLTDFCSLNKSGLADFIRKYRLAMDIDDISFCQEYFSTKEKRPPTITEIKMIDTYWSDHCRHTTFLTTIDDVVFEDKEIQEAYYRYIDTRKELNRTKPINLMDIATLAAKKLLADGKLDNLDQSDEINACTVKMKVNVEGEEQDWLLLFKNETHNHPTEIEPFGGAATCIGGAIRDPLSGRAYVYSAMRVTGGGDPTTPISQTVKGKLPQIKIATTSARGYSSYGNQIGLATGIVDEIYHQGYVAKRMEIGAVVGAVPQNAVSRLTPTPSDKIILLGGATGRDGCGGATGSSKSHDSTSLESCGAEVQKGNAPEERKLQRLFRNPNASLLIKRCNDFGAGGVSVAIGELADGVKINLNAVPKKYEGLDGTELAISESQERMAVVVSAKDADQFITLAHAENLSAVVVAEVQEEPRLEMFWNNQKIVSLSREFLSSNGAEKHTKIEVNKAKNFDKVLPDNFSVGFEDTVGDLNVCDKRGLSEMFDSTIGSNTILAPFGGKYQLSPTQSMAHIVSTEKGVADTCTIMSYGYNPYIAEKSPYHSAYLAVVESVSKLVSTGASLDQTYLTFQEYFEKLGKSPEKWGKPLSALLGGFSAQLDLGIGAIGGKDSMSGSFENINVPPTLVSFAVTVDSPKNIVTSHFNNSGNTVILLRPKYNSNHLPDKDSLLKTFDIVNRLCRQNLVLSSRAVCYGGVAEAVFKMCIGNKLGFDFSDSLTNEDIFGYCYGTFVLEVKELPNIENAIVLGKTTDAQNIKKGETTLSLQKLLDIYQNRLESVYPTQTTIQQSEVVKIDSPKKEFTKPAVKVAKPKVLIPVFPGTNCEYDTAKAFEKVGAEAEIFVINNLSSADISLSVSRFAKELNNSQILFIPGGFSGGDEPDGSGKFITAFMRNLQVEKALEKLLTRDGLIGGICNGFQALIKLGLLPYGEIRNMDENCPTLTFNDISRHQSRIVHTRVCTLSSPWLSLCKKEEIYSLPISHGEGKFVANEKVLSSLVQNGQIATQYVDLQANPTMQIEYNPNGSLLAIEGILSPNGKIFGKMGHSERVGKHLYKNVSGNYDMPIFKSAVEYFK